MVFKCQTDSFLKEFESKVVLCEPTTLKQKNNEGKDEVVNGYNVVLEDTILFPEGGGQTFLNEISLLVQPCDFGLMNDKPVLDVQRKGAEAHHFVHDGSSEPPFKAGDAVRCCVDWERRHDNMQQHSGQHLISAIFEQEYEIETKAWWLGSEVSYIEIDSKINLTSEQIARVEKMCNNLIAEATPVTVKILHNLNIENVPAEFSRATKGLPKDHFGDIRVIQIEGIDTNMCCGTHVSNLAQLQCIKLLNVEKNKNRQFLNFLVGSRVLRRLHECFERECEFNTVLKGGPQWHLDLVKKIQVNQKSSQRSLASCLKELAIHEASKLKAIQPQPKWYSIHRKDGMDTDFNSTFLRNAPEIKNGGEGLLLLFLTAADDSGDKANLMLFGDETVISDLSEKICDLLEGKGKGKGQRFQAKVNNLKKIPACEKLIAEYFGSK